MFFSIVHSARTFHALLVSSRLHPAMPLAVAWLRAFALTFAFAVSRTFAFAFLRPLPRFAPSLFCSPLTFDAFRPRSCDRFSFLAPRPLHAPSPLFPFLPLASLSRVIGYRQASVLRFRFDFIPCRLFWSTSSQKGLDLRRTCSSCDSVVFVTSELL
jgi:hypothetical protein